MEVKGITLTEPFIKAWLLKLMAIGRKYDVNELFEMVTDSHLAAGGLDSTAKHRKQQIKAALSKLKAEGLVENPEFGYWVMKSNDEVSYLPTEKEVEEAAQETAEIIVGQGNQFVYGWYLPAYKRLAEIEGNSLWPMKVGRTADSPEKRMMFQAPEKPKLGFLLRTDRARHWESHLHGHLHLKGKHLPEAVGTEWFMTSPECLYDIWKALQELINPGQENEK